MKIDLILTVLRSNDSGFYKDIEATTFGYWMMYDLDLAAQNICFMADRLGLGTVIVGLFDHDRAREVIGVPDEYERSP